MQEMVKQQMKEQSLEMGRKFMVQGLDKATLRIKELKAAGKLNQMSPELRAAIKRLCVEAAQMGGKKTRKHKGKKSTQRKKKKYHKKTHKKRK